MSLIECVASVGLLLLVIGEGASFVAKEMSLVSKVSERIRADRRTLNEVHRKILSGSCQESKDTLKCEARKRVRMLFLP